RDQLAAVQTAFEARHGELVGQHAQLKDDAAALDAERGKVARSVAPASLAQYEQLRRDKRGRAVSKVERSTCQGCRIALPMGLVQRVRAGRDFVFCPSCGRILYA
ncbi:MAG: zinc ribbon domain-containing protein, partial [Candidatus Dormibacteraceae bacterium]